MCIIYCSTGHLSPKDFPNKGENHVAAAKKNLEGSYHYEMQRLTGMPVFCVLMDSVCILSPGFAHYTL